MCVCSDSRNDVPRVAQRYGTIAAHTRRRSSVLVVFVVFCVHVYRTCGKTPAALCPMISKYREIVGPGNSSADDSRVQKRRTIEYDFLF